jgi:phosphohistidine phosphatase
MPMLHLIRHAKASRKEEGGDHRRGLTRRGREMARRVGMHLPQAVGTLDLVLVSSAARTCATLDLAVAGFAERPRCLIEDELYLASAERLLERLGRLPESDGNVLLIGHNPGLYELAVGLAAPDGARSRALAADRFSTAARASFRISTTWAALGGRRHELVDYVVAESLPRRAG